VTKDLIGFLLFYTLYVPMVWFIRPHQFRKFLYPGFFLVLTVMFGFLIFAIRYNGGSIGPLMGSNPIPMSVADRTFRVFQCLFTVIGTWGGAAERFSDWSRYAESRNAPNVGLFVGMPLGLTFSVAVGCISTSALYGATGVLEWNPLVVLSTLQQENYTASTRAATFFAGATLFLCQVIVNCCNNTVSWGMDMAGAFRT
jgi:NCS1 family nucleobase:cation symporter-1